MHYTIYGGGGGETERREDRERNREGIRIIKVNFVTGVPGNKRHPHYMMFTMEKSPA